MKYVISTAILIALLLAFGCVLPNGNPLMVGNDSDAHGCKASAGYSWCGALQKCILPFSENCTNATPPQACTAEAKICPDGSAVERTGPNCEFTPCPAINNNGSPVNYTLYGWISIGPLCPVEPCNRTFDYSVARVNVYDAASKKIVARANANSAGYYGVSLQPGSYLVNVTDSSGNAFGIPRMSYTQPITVTANHVFEMDFNIDTGIR